MRASAPTPVLSAFHWRGPSQVVNKLGRIKTERQMLLDATRVNLPVDLGAHGKKTNSEKAAR